MKLSKLLREHRISSACVYGAAGDPPTGWERGAHTAWTVTLIRHDLHDASAEPLTLTTPFYMGLAHTGEPKIEDVLSSLMLDADVLQYDGFEDWAENFGYDTDSRSAERTYQACMAMAPKVEAFLDGLPDDVLEAIREQ